MYFDQRCASSIASWSPCLIPPIVGDQVMTDQDTPSGTRMMWNAKVKAICDRALWHRVDGEGHTRCAFSQHGSSSSEACHGESTRRSIRSRPPLLLRRRAVVPGERVPTGVGEGYPADHLAKRIKALGAATDQECSSSGTPPRGGS